jgi:hypothetical protein
MKEYHCVIGVKRATEVKKEIEVFKEKRVILV